MARLGPRSTLRASDEGHAGDPLKLETMECKMAEPMRPNETEIIDRGDEIILDFKNDNGESQQISMSRTWLPQLLSRLMKEVPSGQAVPIDRSSLQVGASFSLEGWQVQRRNDGARRLVLAVNLPDQARVVTIPIELSAKEAESLVNQLE